MKQVHRILGFKNTAFGEGCSDVAPYPITDLIDPLSTLERVLPFVTLNMIIRLRSSKFSRCPTSKKLTQRAVIKCFFTIPTNLFLVSADGILIGHKEQ